MSKNKNAIDLERCQKQNSAPYSCRCQKRPIDYRVSINAGASSIYLQNPPNHTRLLVRRSVSMCNVLPNIQPLKSAKSYSLL